MSKENMYTILYDDDAFNHKGLSENLQRFDGYSVFHDLRFIDIYNGLGTFKLSSILVLDNDEVLGYAVFTTFSEFSGMKRYVTTRSTMAGPPLFRDADVLRILLVESYRRIPRISLYLKIKGNARLKSMLSHCQSVDYKWIPHLNFLVDLSGGAEVVWSRISNTRRKQIKRAERRGLTVNLVKSGSFDEHYVLLKETYDQAKLPLYPKELIKRAIEAFSPTNQTLLVEVRLDGLLVAFRLILLCQNKMYDWFAGSTPEYFSYYPNDIAVWKALEWGSVNGYGEFDFGGAGHPDKPYGVREFKRKFGGEEVNFGVFNRINAPVRNWMLDKFRSLRS